MKLITFADEKKTGLNTLNSRTHSQVHSSYIYSCEDMRSRISPGMSLQYFIKYRSIYSHPLSASFVGRVAVCELFCWRLARNSAIRDEFTREYLGYPTTTDE